MAISVRMAAERLVKRDPTFKGLVGICPWSKTLTHDEKDLVQRACRVSPAYFIAMVSENPENGTVKRGPAWCSTRR